MSKEEFSNEKESNSITNQKLIIDNYLENNKEYKLVDYYIDDGYSGTNFNRPEFQRMLEDIKNKKNGDDYLPLKNFYNDMYAKDISKKVRSSLIVKKYND